MYNDFGDLGKKKKKKKKKKGGVQIIPPTQLQPPVTIPSPLPVPPAPEYPFYWPAPRYEPTRYEQPRPSPSYWQPPEYWGPPLGPSYPWQEMPPVTLPEPSFYMEPFWPTSPPPSAYTTIRPSITSYPEFLRVDEREVETFFGQEPRPGSKEDIIQKIIGVARVLFPGETAKAEAYIRNELARRGIATGQDYLRSKTQEFFSNPFVWLLVGGGVIFLVTRR